MILQSWKWASSFSSLLLRWRPCARNCWSRCVTSWDWRTVTYLDSASFRVRLVSGINLVEVTKCSLPMSVKFHMLFCCVGYTVNLSFNFFSRQLKQTAFDFCKLSVHFTSPHICKPLESDYSVVWTKPCFYWKIFDLQVYIMHDECIHKEYLSQMKTVKPGSFFPQTNNLAEKQESALNIASLTCMSWWSPRNQGLLVLTGSLCAVRLKLFFTVTVQRGSYLWNESPCLDCGEGDSGWQL